MTKRAKGSIDLALTVMCIRADRGQTLGQSDIAEICGCTRGYIDKIERAALTKLKSSALVNWTTHGELLSQMKYQNDVTGNYTA